MQLTCQHVAQSDKVNQIRIMTKTQVDNETNVEELRKSAPKK